MFFLSFSFLVRFYFVEVFFWLVCFLFVFIYFLFLFTFTSILFYSFIYFCLFVFITFCFLLSFSLFAFFRFWCHSWKSKETVKTDLCPNIWTAIYGIKNKDTRHLRTLTSVSVNGIFSNRCFCPIWLLAHVIRSSSIAWCRAGSPISIPFSSQWSSNRQITLLQPQLSKSLSHQS